MFYVEEPEMFYARKDDFPLKAETYKIIGRAMEVHKTLGKGFLEIVYKDALELELKWADIPHIREKSFMIDYKGTLLKRMYNADFVVYDKIIIEVKSQAVVIDANYKQTINYLAASNLTVGLILNFGEDSLSFNRVILT